MRQNTFDLLETASADSLVTAQTMSTRASCWSSSVAQVARSGFDKRITSVYGVPCGNDNILPWTAVSITETSAAVLSHRLLLYTSWASLEAYYLEFPGQFAIVDFELDTEN